MEGASWEEEEEGGIITCRHERCARRMTPRPRWPGLTQTMSIERRAGMWKCAEKRVPPSNDDSGSYCTFGISDASDRLRALPGCGRAWRAGRARAGMEGGEGGEGGRRGGSGSGRRGGSGSGSGSGSGAPAKEEHAVLLRRVHHVVELAGGPRRVEVGDGGEGVDLHRRRVHQHVELGVACSAEGAGGAGGRR